jgi:hypothetical protein
MHSGGYRFGRASWVADLIPDIPVPSACQFKVSRAAFLDLDEKCVGYALGAVSPSTGDAVGNSAGGGADGVIGGVISAGGSDGRLALVRSACVVVGLPAMAAFFRAFKRVPRRWRRLRNSRSLSRTTSLLSCSAFQPSDISQGRAQSTAAGAILLLGCQTRLS